MQENIFPDFKMTNKRKIYFRKKGEGYVFDCKVKSKTVHLWTLPKNAEAFLKKLCEASFFPKQKSNEIKTIMMSSDKFDKNYRKYPKNLRTIKINGTLKSDGSVEGNRKEDGELNELVERVE